MVIDTRDATGSSPAAPSFRPHVVPFGRDPPWLRRKGTSIAGSFSQLELTLAAWPQMWRSCGVRSTLHTVLWTHNKDSGTSIPIWRFSTRTC